MHFSLEQKDSRYAMMFNDMNKLSVKNISIDYNYSENSVVYMDKVKNAVIEKPIIYERNKIYFESK
jgi:hypothetical protein